MFDVFIYKMPRVAKILDPALLELLKPFSKDDSDFWLGLQREYKDAALLAKAIEDAHGHSTIAEEVYKNPMITQEMGYQIAMPEFKKQYALVQERYTQVLEWKSPVFSDLYINPIVWIFFSGSPTLQGLGLIPGGISVCVDKMNGQIISSMDLAKRSDDIRRAGGVRFIDDDLEK